MHDHNTPFQHRRVYTKECVCFIKFSQHKTQKSVIFEIFKMTYK